MIKLIFIFVVVLVLLVWLETFLCFLTEEGGYYMTESEVIKYLLNNTELDTETVILVVDVLSDRGVLRLKKDYEIIKILDKLKDTYAKK